MRFKSPEQASQAAAIIKRSSRVLEEPLVPVEEFSVQARVLLTARYAIVVIYVLFWNALIGLVFLMGLLTAFGTFGFVVGMEVLAVLVVFAVWLVFVRITRRIPGWIRFEGKSIVVRSDLGWIPILPQVIEWKSPNIIVLGGHGTKYELSFPTAESLTQAVTKIRTAFPQVQEILSETNNQAPS